MNSNSISPGQLVAELEDLIRTMPPVATAHHHTAENFGWCGRVAAVIEAWNPAKAIGLNASLGKFQGEMSRDTWEGYREVAVLLNQARSDLRLRTVGPSNVAIAQGGVFDYFDELRKIIELASKEAFFVDPYLDAEFISRYLPHLRSGVPARLLTGNKRLSTLLPAVELFRNQSKNAVAVRSTPGIHDRYLFIDKASCYQSGASFKDGAKQAPTTLTQITDACSAVLDTYERLWSAAKVER